MRVMLGILLILTAGLAGAAEERTWTAEQQEVLDVMSQGPVGINDNFDGWVKGFDQEWSYWEVGTDSIRPKDIHMERVRSYIGEGNRVTGYQFHPVDVKIFGDIALCRFIAEETITQVNGEELVVRFSSATILRKEADIWKYVANNITYLEPDSE